MLSIFVASHLVGAAGEHLAVVCEEGGVSTAGGRLHKPAAVATPQSERRAAGRQRHGAQLAAGVTAEHVGRAVRVHHH